MKQVVFLYNELLDENKQKLAKLPLEFICFAYINNATMYYIDKKYVAIRIIPHQRTLYLLLLLH